MYQNISRKYRPQTFKNIVGQDAIVTTLKNAIRLGKVAPAYLFCGCRGTGKTTLARLFAKALNCHSLTANTEPCNQCPSCLDIMQGKALDILEIDGASNRGIDDIRQLNETIGYASANSQYKIYIIDEVHMLTKEAFNALLKTLEEPPSNVKFFFATTEPHKVLPTITSRCQRFDLHRLSPEQIIEKLEKIATDLGATVDKEALQLIGTMAEGGLRDAESLLDQLLCYTEGPLTYAEASQMLGISPRSFYFRLDQAIDSYNLSFGFELAHEVFSSGKDITAFLDGLIEHYRTLLLIKLQLPPAAYLPEKEQKEYIRSAALYTQDQCLYLLDYLMHWYKEIHKTPFKRITLEMIFLHLIRSKKRISAPELVRRLEELDLSHQPKEPPAKITDSEKSNFLNAIAKEKQSLVDPPTVRNVASVSKETTLKQNPNPVSTIPVQPQMPEIATEKPTLTKAPIINPSTSLAQDQEIKVSKEESRTTTTQSSQFSSKQSTSKYDTLIRFAAVELEGHLKKE
ncbi:MAG TPA: DNA polymerase III subunit gamma/tau [Rhabdochlamydiaceae bacterium]|nr:DNA polymerase III subunit gamma/tau [Rhabdochlamydiaceae bacterium]